MWPTAERRRSATSSSSSSRTTTTTTMRVMVVVAFLGMATTTAHAAVFTEGGSVGVPKQENVETGPRAERPPLQRQDAFDEGEEQPMDENNNVEEMNMLKSILDGQGDVYAMEREAADELAIEEAQERAIDEYNERMEEMNRAILEEMELEAMEAEEKEKAEEEEEKQHGAPKQAREAEQQNELPEAVPVAPKEEAPVEVAPAKEEPTVPQKKGQSEFVSFVEPPESLQTKSMPGLDKRRLTTSAEYSAGAPRYGSNLLLVAVGTVMSVGMVGTVVAGGVYFKRRRETPDDSEYAPYTGTGPGFKRGGKGEKGDETLAYKAQLHQYQQAKQKIICGDDAPGVLESEGEDAEDENNYSVYECPGLAPTGDIEVCNPNFAALP